MLFNLERRYFCLSLVASKSVICELDLVYFRRCHQVNPGQTHARNSITWHFEQRVRLMPLALSHFVTKRKQRSTRRKTEKNAKISSLSQITVCKSEQSCSRDRIASFSHQVQHKTFCRFVFFWETPFFSANNSTGYNCLVNFVTIIVHSKSSLKRHFLRALSIRTLLLLPIIRKFSRF